MAEYRGRSTWSLDSMKLGALHPQLLDPPALDSGVTRRATALADRTVAELSAGEIAFCLRQSIALDAVVPVALDLLAADPIREAELYPCDLLASLIHVANEGRLSASAMNELSDICSDAIARIDSLATSRRPEIAAFLVAARESNYRLERP